MSSDTGGTHLQTGRADRILNDMQFFGVLMAILGVLTSVIFDLCSSVDGGGVEGVPGGLLLQSLVKSVHKHMFGVGCVCRGVKSLCHPLLRVWAARNGCDNAIRRHYGSWVWLDLCTQGKAF